MKILSRFLNGNFELLEPYEGKLSCTVLRGESGSNAADLLDNLSVTRYFLAFTGRQVFESSLAAFFQKTSTKKQDCYFFDKSVPKYESAR